MFDSLISQPSTISSVTFEPSGTPRALGLDDAFLKFAQGRIQAIADLVFREITDYFHQTES